MIPAFDCLWFAEVPVASLSREDLNTRLRPVLLCYSDTSLIMAVQLNTALKARRGKETPETLQGELQGIVDQG